MKVNKAIEVTYQAAGSATGLTDVQMDVYDEGHAIDAAKGGIMTEIGSTGRYYKQFTPDAEGEWQVQIDSATVPGKALKHYTVVAHDIDSVGDAVAGLNDIASSDIDTALATYDAATGAEIAALNDLSAANVAAELETYDAVKKSELDALQGGSETLETIKTAVDGISSVAPPMVG